MIANMIPWFLLTDQSDYGMNGGQLVCWFAVTRCYSHYFFFKVMPRVYVIYYYFIPCFRSVHPS